MKRRKVADYYFPVCDVKGCLNESSSGGSHFKNTGYWMVCSEHGKLKEQPEMKKYAVKREKSRKPDGTLPYRIRKKAAK